MTKGLLRDVFSLPYIGSVNDNCQFISYDFCYIQFSATYRCVFFCVDQPAFQTFKRSKSIANFNMVLLANGYFKN